MVKWSQAICTGAPTSLEGRVVAEQEGAKWMPFPDLNLSPWPSGKGKLGGKMGKMDRFQLDPQKKQQVWVQAGKGRREAESRWKT